MRILTRGDFDGLTSSVLLTEVETIREIKFAHPKDAQDGKVPVDGQDIIVNLPYIRGCGLWFDHHVSEEGKLPKMGPFKGRFEVAPSAARVVYNHFAPQHKAKLDKHLEMLDATDRLDSADLTMNDVCSPSGWILFGLTIDPRSGLGPEFQKYFRWLVEFVKEVPLQKVMHHREVKIRTDRILLEQEEFKALAANHSRQDGNVIVTNFRGLKDKPVGNRFLIYTMYPDANVEMRIFDGHQGAVVVAVGHSIFNRTCKVNIGEMLKAYGGGGHRGAGTAQLPPATAEKALAEIRAGLKANQ